MAKNKSAGSIPASATEAVNIPASGGRGKSVDFGRNRQPYGKDLGGGMGAPEDLQRIGASGRGPNRVNKINPRGGYEPDGPDSVSFGGAKKR